MSIDIDAPGKYPIVLSDALLGKPSQESFTSIRYNHKPDATSSSALSSQRLQPSKSDPSSYDLSFSDESGRYKYNGVQTSEDGEYVLIFNPEKKHFVLHRLDSTFDMNLVSAPWENNASALQSQYTQLESASKPDAEVPQRKASKATKSVPAAKQEPKRRKSTQAKKKPPVREPTPEEEEGGDSDDGLTIEYPDARNAPQYKPQPSTAVQQLVSDEEEEEEEDDDDDEDADGEADEQQNRDVDYLTLPSPANNHAGLVSDEDMELDLEAELEQALQETTEGAGNDESDESEEE